MSKKRAFEAWTNDDFSLMLKYKDYKKDPISRHFILLGIVKHSYKDRQDPEMRKLCKVTAQTHLAELPQLAGHLRFGPDKILPNIPTFTRYATILTEDGQYDEAINVCQEAIRYGVKDGTKGGYEGRIERIKKKAG